MEPESQTINLIGAGTLIKGEIRANGDVRIDGSLMGSIHSKGKVVVGASGSVEGEIVCQNADISGNIKAEIQVAELLSLKATARLTGNIMTGKIAIEPGAIFTGSCTMNNGGNNTIKENRNAVNSEAAQVEGAAG
ncbi:MAG: polymer-forming cytoskeletal protein [Bacteroidota bacterium]